MYIMGDKSCNRCGKRGLTWDQEFHRKTGKWKLENHKTVTGKWCNKPKEITMGRKSDYDFCELCSESKMGKCRVGEKEEHIKKYHPDGRTMSTLDWNMYMGMNPMYLKYYRSDVNYHRYKHLDKAKKKD